MVSWTMQRQWKLSTNSKFNVWSTEQWQWIICSLTFSEHDVKWPQIIQIIIHFSGFVPCQAVNEWSKERHIQFVRISIWKLDLVRIWLDISIRQNVLKITDQNQIQSFYPHVILFYLSSQTKDNSFKTSELQSLNRKSLCIEFLRGLTRP